MADSGFWRVSRADALGLSAPRHSHVSIGYLRRRVSTRPPPWRPPGNARKRSNAAILKTTSKYPQLNPVGAGFNRCPNLRSPGNRRHRRFHRQQLKGISASHQSGRLGHRLTRISHQLSTAATDPGMSTALRSVGLLDVLSNTSAGPSVARLVSTPVCAASLRNLVRNAG